MWPPHFRHTDADFADLVQVANDGNDLLLGVFHVAHAHGAHQFQVFLDHLLHALGDVLVDDALDLLGRGLERHGEVVLIHLAQHTLDSHLVELDDVLEDEVFIQHLAGHPCQNNPDETAYVPVVDLTGPLVTILGGIPDGIVEHIGPDRAIFQVLPGDGVRNPPGLRVVVVLAWNDRQRPLNQRSLVAIGLGQERLGLDGDDDDAVGQYVVHVHW